MAQDELDLLLRDVPPPPRPMSSARGGARSQSGRPASRAVKPRAMFSPDLSAHVDDMLTELGAQGYDVRLGDTLRTPQQQAQKVAQGVSRTYNSRHLTGRAADLIVHKDGQPDWDTNNPAWSAIGAAAKKRGLRWGGDFKSLYDPGHVELGGGDDLDDVISTLPATGQGDELDSLLGELPSAGDIAADEIIRTEATVDRRTGRPLALDDGRRLSVDVATVAAGAPQNRLRQPPRPDIYTPAGRAQRDAIKQAGESPGARFEIDVRLPDGRSDWTDVSGKELAQAGVRQFAASRRIDPEFVEQWLSQNGDFRLYDADGQREQAPADFIGTEFYDPQARTIRVSALGPQLKQLEREYQASRNLSGRAAEFITSNETTAGEKFLGVTGPVVSGAVRAADIVTRPLQAASTGLWSGVRKRDLGEAYNDAKAELLTGETNAGAGNWLAEQVAGSETLKGINPNLPGMAGAVTEMLTDPANLVPGGLLTKPGRALARGTKGFQRVERALSAASDARLSGFFRRGGRVLDLEASPPSPVPESPATLAAQFRSALSPESPRAAVLVSPGEQPPRVPTGFAAIPVADGTLYLNRAKARQLGLRTAADVKNFLAKNGSESLIGKVSPIADTSTGMALRTENAAGGELSTSVVTSPDAANVQAAIDQAQFPQQAARQELMPAEEAVRRRMADSEAFPVDEALFSRSPYYDLDPQEVLRAAAQEQRERLTELARLEVAAARGISPVRGNRLSARGERKLQERMAKVRTESEHTAALVEESFGRDAAGEFNRRAGEGLPTEFTYDPRAGERGAVNVSEIAAGARQLASKDTLLDLINAPRTIKASVDLSAPLRQGAIQTLTEPLAALRATRQMFRAAARQRNFDEIVRSIAAHPDADLARRSGLYFATAEAAAPLTRRVPRAISRREEAFMSRLAGSLPLVKQSERAYTTYLDQLRMEIFSKYARELRETGVTNPEEFQSIAHWLNLATGRGSIGDWGRDGGAILNAAFFSPRYEAREERGISCTRDEAIAALSKIEPEISQLIH